jgi:hypothetical protein
MAGDKDDWKRRPKFVQMTLQFGAAQVRQSRVKKNASRLAFVRTPIKEVLG